MNTHDLYVAAAYGITVVVLVALIVHLLMDQRARKREMADLEKQGLRRRSDRETAQ
jgi:heme exporter protein D